MSDYNKLSAAVGAHLQKQSDDAEKTRAATKPDPNRPRPTSFQEAIARSYEQLEAERNYRKANPE